jgi:CRP/FNR family cyclic AMP-dependent transcriptional regulator
MAFCSWQLFLNPSVVIPSAKFKFVSAAAKGRYYFLWKFEMNNRPEASDTRRGTKFDAAAFLATNGDDRHISKHKKNGIIFTQDDASNAVFYIKTGKIKVTTQSDQGKEAIVAILGADEFFGEGCLIGQSKRLGTASAMTECITMRVDKAEFLRVLHDEPGMSSLFVAHILSRNARVEADLVDQLFNNTEKRLARVLLILANYGKAGPPERIIAKLTHETLSEMIGTTRSRVSHFMNKFRKLGYIDYNGHLEVHKSLLKVVLADQPRTVEERV